jgi:hypothetical protein
LSDKIHLRKVNISLNGIAFRSKEKIPEQSFLKVILYTKPHFLPIILNAICVYNRTINPHHYRVALQFENMTQEQEKLLSQHIMLAQEVPYPITS